MMIRPSWLLIRCLLIVLVAMPAQRLMAQAQTNIPDKVQPATPDKKTPARVDAVIDTDTLAEAGGVSLDAWLKGQADALLDIVQCYLDKSSMQKEVALETKDNSSSTHLIEVRIKLLKTLAMHNAASHCK